MYEFIHVYRGKKETVLRTSDRQKAIEWSKTFLSTYVQTPEHKHILRHPDDSSVSIEAYAATHLEMNAGEREKAKEGVWHVKHAQYQDSKRKLKDAQRYKEKKIMTKEQYPKEKSML